MKNRNSNSKMRKNNSRRIFNNKLLNNKLVNNKITLFIVAALALFSLYIHITKSHFSAVLLFFLTAGLVYTFTKNMTLVLGAAFIVTTIASMSKGLFGLKEGFKEGNDDDSGKTASTEGGKVVEEEVGDGETPNTGVANVPKVAKATKVADVPIKGEKFGNQKLSPALFNTPSKKNVEQQLGKASEVEQAYDNLEKIMGTEKINSISTDTKDLIKQQNELIKQLKTMTPALNSAMSSLGNLDLNKLTGMFNSATKNLSEIKE